MRTDGLLGWSADAQHGTHASRHLDGTVGADIFQVIGDMVAIRTAIISAIDCLIAGERPAST